jgi:hypothetical protein
MDIYICLLVHYEARKTLTPNGDEELRAPLSQPEAQNPMLVLGLMVSL